MAYSRCMHVIILDELSYLLGLVKCSHLKLRLFYGHLLSWCVRSAGIPITIQNPKHKYLVCDRSETDQAGCLQVKDTREGQLPVLDQARTLGHLGSMIHKKDISTGAELVLVVLKVSKD